MKRIVCTVALMLFLTACAEVKPFIDSRREAGQTGTIGQSKPDKIAVCYNPLWDSDKSVRDLAQKACAERGKRAVHSDTKYFNCRLFSPNTAFYDCRK